MTTKKRAEASIALIVAVVIGLIIIVVIIAIMSGKLGSFSKGAENANTCLSLCKSSGYADDQGGSETPGVEDDSNPPVKCKCR